MSNHPKINEFINHLHYGKRSKPSRDWLTLLSLCMIILAGIVVLSLHTFDTVASGGIIGTAQQPQPQFFSQASIDTIQTVFANRATEDVKYTNGTYQFSDPSQ